MNDLYCVKCRQKTANKDLKQKVSKNGRHMLSALCSVCGTKKNQFVKGK